MCGNHVRWASPQRAATPRRNWTSPQRPEAQVFPFGCGGGVRPVLTFLRSQQDGEHSDSPERFKFHFGSLRSAFELNGFFGRKGAAISCHYFTHTIKNESGLGVCSGLPAGVTAFLKGEARLKIAIARLLHTAFVPAPQKSKSSLVTGLFTGGL